jgi:hypothetical protein
LLAAIKFIMILKAELSFVSHVSCHRPLEMGLVKSKFIKTHLRTSQGQGRDEGGKTGGRRREGGREGRGRGEGRKWSETKGRRQQFFALGRKSKSRHLCAPVRNAHSRLKKSYGQIVGNARIS